MFYKRKIEHTQIDREMLDSFLKDLYSQLNRGRIRREELMTAYSIGRQALNDDTFIVIEDIDTKVRGVYVQGIPYELMETWYYKEAFM